MRTPLALLLAVLLPLPAGATEREPAVRTSTSVAGTALPQPTVSAAWTGARLDVSGSNLPGATSSVAAIWTGTVAAGAPVRVVRDSVATEVRTVVERRARGGWHRCASDAAGTATCRTRPGETSVPVRVRILATYDEAAAGIADVFTIA